MVIQAFIPKNAPSPRALQITLWFPPSDAAHQIAQRLVADHDDAGIF
jgi:hypothetical protein